MKEKDRRDFLKGAALASVAGAVAGSEALADIRTLKINTQAKAVMPNGQLKTRVELMQQLGLSGSIGTDAWLNIILCGSNAGALTERQKSVLVARGFKFQGVEMTAAPAGKVGRRM
jgi:hypothetical protein